MNQIKIIAQQSESTVVTEYKSENQRQTNYQSERELETALIDQLKNQGYTFLQIKDNTDLLSNLRDQLEKLNRFKFSDKEWFKFLNDYLDNPNEGLVEKTKKVQEDYIYPLRREDGSLFNVFLMDKKQIHNNFLQVIHQFEIEGTHKNIYDVTILVNGLPLVHIELKRRGVSIREAFNQIKRYERDSFWAGNGL